LRALEASLKGAVGLDYYRVAVDEQPRGETEFGRKLKGALASRQPRRD
jgi:hypothetical protein